MTDYEAWIAQLDLDRPNWPLAFAEQRDLYDALRPLLHTTTLEQAQFARTLLRTRVGPRLFSAVQSYHSAKLGQAALQPAKAPKGD